MTYSNGFGFTNCGPFGCSPTNYGFTNGTPVGCSPIGFGGGNFGQGNWNTTGGFTGQYPVNYGSNNYGHTGFTGQYPVNYGINNCGPTGCFTPGFTGQYPVNCGWNNNTGFGYPIASGFNGTPWTGHGINGFTPNFTPNFIPGFTPTSNWNGSTGWNNWNTIGGIPSDNRFFSGTGYSPLFSQWGNTTPWNTVGCTDNCTTGFNQFSNGITPWGFNPAWQNTTGFGTPWFNGYGYNTINSFNPAFTNGFGSIPTTGSFGITNPSFGGLNTINPTITNSFPGFTGYPLSTIGQGAFANSTPWTNFGGTFGGQLPFNGIPFNTTGYNYNSIPFNTTGFNGVPFNTTGYTGWQNGFGFNGSTNGQGPVFGQGYTNNPFVNGGSFQNYPFNNGTPVNNGTIGLSREAA